MEQRSVTSHFVILLGLMAFALLIAFMLYPGLPTAGGEFASDWSLHVGKIKILMYGLPKISRWNPYWYFGCPFLRFWPPFCFSLYALVSWIFQISIEKTLRFIVLLFLLLVHFQLTYSLVNWNYQNLQDSHLLSSFYLRLVSIGGWESLATYQT